MKSTQTFTVQASFDAVPGDDSDEAIEKYLDYLERYGAIEPAVSVGNHILGVTAQVEARVAFDAHLAVRDALAWKHMRESRTTNDDGSESFSYACAGCADR